MAALVRALCDGQVRAEDLSLDDRRCCVDHLTFEGFSNSEIAELMHTTERTVRRDRVAARGEHAIRPDRQLGDELLGEFHRIVLASVRRLVRMAHDPQTPPYARLWAEESMVRNYQRLIEMARKLRYFEDGGTRLSEQRIMDPKELERAPILGEAEQALLLARGGVREDPVVKAYKRLMDQCGAAAE